MKAGKALSCPFRGKSLILGACCSQLNPFSSIHSPDAKLRTCLTTCRAIIDGSVLDTLGLAIMDETLKTSHMNTLQSQIANERIKHSQMDSFTPMLALLPHSDTSLRLP